MGGTPLGLYIPQRPPPPLRVRRYQCPMPFVRSIIRVVCRRLPCWVGLSSPRKQQEFFWTFYRRTVWLNGLARRGSEFRFFDESVLFFGTFSALFHLKIVPFSSNFSKNFSEYLANDPIASEWFPNVWQKFLGQFVMIFLPANFKYFSGRPPVPCWL